MNKYSNTANTQSIYGKRRKTGYIAIMTILSYAISYLTRAVTVATRTQIFSESVTQARIRIE